MRKIWSALGVFILDTLEIFAIAAAIFVVVHVFIVQPYTVDGKSMEPNFHHGDYLLTDKLTYRFNYPQRGDIIIFKYPKDPTDHFIKRIIALPEESLEIKNGNIYIYNKQSPEGFMLKEEYLKEGVTTKGGAALPENVKIMVPKNKVVVMGDNRGNSSDSREWGFVPLKNIVGRAWVRCWPYKYFGKIDTPNYQPNSEATLPKPLSFLPALSQIQPDRLS